MFLFFFFPPSKFPLSGLLSHRNPPQFDQETTNTAPTTTKETETEPSLVTDALLPQHRPESNTTRETEREKGNRSEVGGEGHRSTTESRRVKI